MEMLQARTEAPMLVALPVGDGLLQAFVARPSGDDPHPGILLVHEVWGLDPHMRDVADRLVQQGFVVIAPDLYSLRPLGFPVAAVEAAVGLLANVPAAARADPEAAQAELAKLPAEERPDVEKALAWLRTRDLEEHVPGLRASLDYLQRHDAVDASRCAALGFCMGGSIVWRLAGAGAPTWKNVVFYGDNPPLERVGEIQGSSLGLYGAEDARITPKVPALAQAMAAAHRPFEHHIYPGAAHGFFNDTRPNYRREPAAAAWQRVLTFLRVP